ncbi:MAG: PAS domain S-box protein [Syntrophaceae bacterium]|nr:PAS domain S-box protein [Syntrophaceae bacterium]
MKASGKTKKQLLEEIAAMKMRISELEGIQKGRLQPDFGEKIGRYFPKANHMQEAIYVVFDRKYEFINDQFSQMFGYTSEEICHTNFDPMNLIAPECRGLIREQYRQGTRGEFSARQFEYTGMKKDGSRIECESFVLFVPYKWGVAIHGMLRNISVQKRISEELQRHRIDLQIVLNSIPTSIFYTDKEHRFIRANKAFCKALGFPLEEILGKTFTDLFPNLPAEQLSNFFQVNAEVMSSGISKRGFIATLPSIRGRRWLQVDRMPCRDDDGDIVGVICLAIDISDLKETEEKLWYMSFHDVLTGLYNRTYFDEELNRLANGRQFPVSIITVKVDDLLAVNENEGIAAGNNLLKQTAKILKIFRNEDVVARVGGDVFAALMPSSDQSVVENIIQRLKNSIKEHNKRNKGEMLNLSLGFATGEKGCSLFDTLVQAEADMSRNRG